MTAPAAAHLAPRPVAPLRRGEFHLWTVSVRPRPCWAELLDDAERDRAARFGPAAARDVFVTSRAAQRLIGARYLQVRPAEVRTERDCEHCGGPHGRPRWPGSGLEFSVSHSGNWLLLAVTGDGRVGVDVERLDPARDTEALVRAALTDAERREHAAVPAGRRAAWLLAAWTRKEAAMKLTGLGLAAPPHRLDVRTDTPQANAIPRWPRRPITLTTLPAPPSHIAALATTTPPRAIHRLALPEPPTPQPHTPQPNPPTTTADHHPPTATTTRQPPHADAARRPPDADRRAPPHPPPDDRRSRSAGRHPLLATADRHPPNATR